MNTLRRLLETGVSRLNRFPQARLEARLLLLKAAKLPTEVLFSDPDRVPGGRAEKTFERLIAWRCSGVPLAYLTGVKEFWSLPFKTARGVLIPRPETELIVETVLGLSSRRKEWIIDLGTGCGNIAVSLARELPQSGILALDASLRALKLAGENACRHGVRNVTFLNSRFFSALRENGWENRCHFIVSNPPYVSESDWRKLPGEIRSHEPKRALVGGRTGLEFIRRLIRESGSFLRRGGTLVFEIGYGQRDAVLGFFDKEWDDPVALADLAGIPRVIRARRI